VVSVAYFDTSALLKRYVTEIGTGWVKELLASSHAPVVFTSHLTVVEATCAFVRRLREGALPPTIHVNVLAAFDYDIDYKYNILDVVAITIDTARRLAHKHPLRAYDSIHLATAWLSNQELIQAGKPPLTFISADNRLIPIAQAEGLPTDNPNNHP
jgi:uncharacterized protein